MNLNGMSVESNAITISGINAPTSISVSSGSSYSINGSVYATAAGTVKNADKVQVRHTSSTKPKTTVTTILSIGGVSGKFVSTTKP